MTGLETVGVPPKITEETAPFWAATREGKLVVEQCGACEKFSFPPHGVCRHCGARAMHWAPVTPPAVIYSYTINHNQWTATADAQYAIALVEFPIQSVRMIGLLDLGGTEPLIGQEVGFRLDPGPGDVRRPVFTSWPQS